MTSTDDTPLTVVIREEGGYWNVYEIESNYLITQCVTESGARAFCEENFLDIREES